MEASVYPKLTGGEEKKGEWIGFPRLLSFSAFPNLALYRSPNTQLPGRIHKSHKSSKKFLAILALARRPSGGPLCPPC